MEDMKIDSTTRYKKARVISGYEPHRILRMLQEQALGKESKEQIPEDSDYFNVLKNLKR